MTPMWRTCIVGLAALALAAGCKGKANDAESGSSSSSTPPPPPPITETDPKKILEMIDALEHEQAAATKQFAGAQSDADRNAAKKVLIELTKKRQALVARYQQLQP